MTVVVVKDRIEEFKKTFLKEKDPDKVFKEIEKSLDEAIESCCDMVEANPNEALEVLTVAIMVASTAYSRAAYLKLERLEEKVGALLEEGQGGFYRGSI